MGIRATTLHAVVLCSIFAAACGGDDSGGSPDASAAVDAAPPDAEAPVTRGDICGPDGEVAKLFTRLLACNPAFDVLDVQGRLTPSTESAFCNGAVGDYINDGSIALPTHAQLQACLDYIANTACLDLNFSLSDGPCDLLGQVADAGDCEISDQCSAASYCVGAEPGGVCGACTARLTDGMPCTTDDECAGDVCVGTQCGHQGNDGDPCFEDADCLGQRTCNTTTSMCETPRAWVVNDQCDPNADDNECAPFTSGLYCKASGQCAPFLALSAACRTGGISQGLCDVRAYESCPTGGTDAVCTAPTTVTQEGMPCSLVNGEECGAGLACTNPLRNGTCVSYQEEGQSCSNGGAATDQCDLFLQCFPAGAGNTCEYGDYSGECPAP